METADVPLRRKYAKGAESAGQQRFSPLIVSSHAGGHWFESSSLHQNLGNACVSKVFSFSGDRVERLCFFEF